jgi:hypothetical protein
MRLGGAFALLLFGLVLAAAQRRLPIIDVPTDLGGIPISFPTPFSGPGTPVGPPQRVADVSKCESAKPTIVLVPGAPCAEQQSMQSCTLVFKCIELMNESASSTTRHAGMTGSQLDALQSGGVGGCPRMSTPRVAYPDLSWLKNLECFTHMMSLNYDAAGRATNSTGTQIWWVNHVKRRWGEGAQGCQNSAGQ